LICSLCYLLVRCLLQLVLLRPRSQDFKELEIVVLRHELAVLPYQSHQQSALYVLRTDNSTRVRGVVVVDEDAEYTLEMAPVHD
jgi:hypothetical protein